MNQFPNKNYFTMPNEIFSLGLDASEIAVYAYLRCLENRSTYQCWPSYATIGKAIGRTKNTVMQYVNALSEKGLIYTEPTSVLMRSGIKKNGNLRYTIRPIREAIEIFHARQLSAVERATERRQIQRKLSTVNLLPSA
ncbi:helix-turn-helix domain-containing protein [Hominicoprocola fusiformis]